MDDFVTDPQDAFVFGGLEPESFSHSLSANDLLRDTTFDSDAKADEELFSQPEFGELLPASSSALSYTSVSSMSSMSTSSPLASPVPTVQSPGEGSSSNTQYSFPSLPVPPHFHLTRSQSARHRRVPLFLLSDNSALVVSYWRLSEFESLDIVPSEGLTKFLAQSGYNSVQLASVQLAPVSPEGHVRLDERSQLISFQSSQRCALELSQFQEYFGRKSQLQLETIRANSTLDNRNTTTMPVDLNVRRFCVILGWRLPLAAAAPASSTVATFESQVTFFMYNLRRSDHKSPAKDDSGIGSPGGVKPVPEMRPTHPRLMVQISWRHSRHHAYLAVQFSQPNLDDPLLPSTVRHKYYLRLGFEEEIRCMSRPVASVDAVTIEFMIPVEQFVQFTGKEIQLPTVEALLEVVDETRTGLVEQLVWVSDDLWAHDLTLSKSRNVASTSPSSISLASSAGSASPPPQPTRLIPLNALPVLNTFPRLVGLTTSPPSSPDTLWEAERAEPNRQLKRSRVESRPFQASAAVAPSAPPAAAAVAPSAPTAPSLAPSAPPLAVLSSSTTRDSTNSERSRDNTRAAAAKQTNPPQPSAPEQRAGDSHNSSLVDETKFAGVRVNSFRSPSDMKDSEVDDIKSTDEKEPFKVTSTSYPPPPDPEPFSGNPISLFRARLRMAKALGVMQIALYLLLVAGGALTWTWSLFTGQSGAQPAVTHAFYWDHVTVSYSVYTMDFPYQNSLAGDVSWLSLKQCYSPGQAFFVAQIGVCALGVFLLCGAWFRMMGQRGNQTVNCELVLNAVVFVALLGPLCYMMFGCYAHIYGNSAETSVALTGLVVHITSAALMVINLALLSFMRRQAVIPWVSPFAGTCMDRLVRKCRNTLAHQLEVELTPLLETLPVGDTHDDGDFVKLEGHEGAAEDTHHAHDHSGGRAVSSSTVKKKRAATKSTALVDVTSERGANQSSEGSWLTFM